ncbi:hypothetical protein IWW35_005120, partial [Coemansia sp. RSA 1878]
MDESNYDEFGNYIGPELATSSEEESEVEHDVEEADSDHSEDEGPGPMAMELRVEAPQTQIVLHEDKQYYPDAEDVFGPG